MKYVVACEPLAASILCDANTERAGCITFAPSTHQHGQFVCRGCGQALFSAEHQFESHCGWPAFDAANEGAITEQDDPDGRRVEVICSRCQGHLGHVFRGERLTKSNRRYCINGSVLLWAEGYTGRQLSCIIVGAGCFWGVQARFDALEGVFHTAVGYTGGHLGQPSYHQVCSGRSGHTEAVQIFFDAEIISFSTLMDVFFGCHTPTQIDGQGPDIGHQYMSRLFVFDVEQRQAAHDAIERWQVSLKQPIVTEICDATVFWQAEDYHQHYLRKQSQ